MDYQSILSKAWKEQRGAVVILVAFVLIALLSIAALAVDYGYLVVVRTELANVADAASLAATRHIGNAYETMTLEEQLSHTFTRAEIVSVASAIAVENVADGINITINDADVFIGKWDANTRTMYDVNNLTNPDAVRVIARRDAAANGPVGTFFARIFNVDTADSSAEATAALTGIGTLAEGDPVIPVGISTYWFERPEFCEQPIKFYPTGTLEGCAGWNTFVESPSNASRLRSILDAMMPPVSYETPETIAGITQYSFIGGTVSSAFPDFQALFDAMRVLNDGIWDSDLDPNTWTVRVVVYDWPNCSNPNKAITIVGFATAQIYEVSTAPEKTIWARVKCDNVEGGRGGGGNFGTKGSIPGLVK